MKKIALMVTLLLGAANLGYSEVACEDYPHWDCKDPKLVTIDSFIKAYANKGYIAAFDWDGTLYSETVKVKAGPRVGQTRSGQSVWHLYGAEHGYFPMLASADGEQANNTVMRDDYLEGKTSVHSSAYGKFVQIATFEAGMTPAEFHGGVLQYMQDYPTSDYAYFPMLDVMQQFKNNGYQTWVITGSNPYFVTSLIDDLDKNSGYDLLPEGCDAAHPDINSCQIVGNQAKLNAKGTFSMVYDDRFVQLNQATNKVPFDRNIIDGGGKPVAMNEYIQPKVGQPFIFYGGNSGGDYEAIQYVMNQKDVNPMIVAVNPRGTLTDLVSYYEPKGSLVTLSVNSKQ